MVGIVICKERFNIQTLFPQRRNGISIHIAAGSVRRTVGSVRAHTNQRRMVVPFQNLRRRQRQFLISAAKTFSFYMDNSFAAGEQSDLPPAAVITQQLPRQFPTGIRCLMYSTARVKVFPDQADALYT